MRIFLWLFSILLSGTIIHAQHTLKVHVNDLRNTSGTLYFAVFTSEKGFPGDPSQAVYSGKIEKIPSISTSYTFNNVISGEYAVAIFHDEDNNGSMKKNVLGIPLEGTAVSNNAKGKLGPPKYADARFKLDGNKSISVTMWYF